MAMKAAIQILLSLLPVIISSKNIDALIDAALLFVKERLGEDSIAYGLIERVVRHCQEHNCLAELADALSEFLTDRFGATGYTVRYDSALQPIANDLTEIRQKCI